MGVLYVAASTAWRSMRAATSASPRLLTGCISVIAPDGRPVRQVPMGDPMTTNICFCGPGLRTAKITLSATGQLVAMDWPEAGLKLAHEV